MVCVFWMLRYFVRRSLLSAVPHIKELGNKNIEIYNEFSLQHKPGIYLRTQMPKYHVQFERNVSFFSVRSTDLLKKEVDISVFNSDLSTKYAI